MTDMTDHIRKHLPAVVIQLRKEGHRVCLLSKYHYANTDTPKTIEEATLHLPGPGGEAYGVLFADDKASRFEIVYQAAIKMGLAPKE
jgi:hypothetical protein